MRFGFKTAPLDTVSDYVAAVNAHDLRAATALLADDARLTDSGGQVVTGREACADLIERALAFMPGYKLHIDSMHARGNEVLLRGHVEGTYPLPGSPSHFRAIVSRGKLSSWESFGAQPGSVIDWINAQGASAENPAAR